MNDHEVLMSNNMLLAKKIVAVMDEVGQIEKDRTIKDRNGKDMYDYLSEEQTTGALQRAFIKVGLVVMPHEVLEHEAFYVESEKFDKVTKTPITYVKMRYKIIDPDSGAFDFVEAIGYGNDTGDKASNKALTNAFKYVQRQTFAISTGAEEEADHTSSDGQGASVPKAGRKPTQSEQLVRQLSEAAPAPASAQKPTVDQIKEAWKAVSPTHDLKGFDDWYLKMVEKKKTATEMLATLQKSKQPAS